MDDMKQYKRGKTLVGEGVKSLRGVYYKNDNVSKMKLLILL